jgi:multidrug resistance protein, MATE family
MAAAGPRRFSVSSSLLPDQDFDPQKATLRGTGSESAVDETESLLEHGDVDLYTSPSSEAKLLAKYSLPLTATYLLQYSFNLVTIFVVGHIGTNELGAVSLATMTANITGLAVYEGLATSLDTLCAQAYGSGHKTHVGLHLQRMALFLLLVTIPVGVIWLTSGYILSALVPEKDLALLAGKFLRILLLGAPGYALFEAGKRFVQAQGLFNASLLVLLVCTPINILLNYLFVFQFHWGLNGAALAISISQLLLPLTLFFYVRFINPSSLTCWGGFTRQALHSWMPMIHLSVPGIVMVEAEWLAFDIMTFSASYLTTAHLAAQSVVMTTCVVMFHIPFSVSVAVSTRLGNLIGAGNLSAAKVATRTYCVIFAVMGLIDATLLASLRNIIPRAFSEDKVVIKIAAGVMPVLAIFQFFDATTALANGLLRGLGRQSVGGWVNLAVYYLLALPLALFLCFGPAHFKLAGLWIGCVAGSGIISCAEGGYLWFMDWKRAVEDVRERED